MLSKEIFNILKYNKTFPKNQTQAYMSRACELLLRDKLRARAVRGTAEQQLQLRNDFVNARLLALKRAGHVSMFDRPQEFNRAVNAFLREEMVEELAPTCFYQNIRDIVPLITLGGKCVS